MSSLDLITLTQLMSLSSGRPELKIGLIDGPVNIDHPHLESENIHEVGTGSPVACTQSDSIACKHGTFVASILLGKRSSVAPAICPRCTLLVRPVFAETLSSVVGNRTPSATPEDLSAAILECLAAGAKILNLSVALQQLSVREEHQIEAALDLAAKQGVIIVAAAGNQGAVGSSTITRHPWVIPVVACNLQGRTTQYSNLGASIGRRGLAAPGQDISSFSAEGIASFSGTSAATPFVTGTIALLWSEFPKASATEVKSAVTQVYLARRRTIVPPLLNAWAAYRFMARFHQPNH